jgi:aryl-alcohol dehydrogenase-like predicted oxidoreductase
MTPSPARRYSRHPGLHLILEKLHRGECATEEEYRLLSSYIHEFKEDGEASEEPRIANATAAVSSAGMLPGYARTHGAQSFVDRCGRNTVDFFRPAQGLLVSNVGIGTYRGASDPETDQAYSAAVCVALAGGINLIDTSLNYRQQRSECAVGMAIRRFLDTGGGDRDGIVVCSKGGFLVPGAIPHGALAADDVVGGTHSLAPVFLADQIERSRRNLGLETIDVYYLHNPEVQLRFVDNATFHDRLQAAFELLERSASNGLIRYYGTATWDGYLRGALSLPALVEIARKIAGEDHHFRFVQLPLSMGMREATARSAEGGGTFLDVAAELGLTVIASSSLWHGRLSRGLPHEITRYFQGLATDAQRAIQFTRSTPGITTALVGMSNPTHVNENLAVAGVPPLTHSEYQLLQSAF